jgi:hemolysin activation/secretion protein
MRYVLMILFFISMPVVVQNAAAQEIIPATAVVLIKNISIEGFLLQDKEQFVKLFKPYRNKYLSTADMDEILQKVQKVYEQEGYQSLVSIDYHVKKHWLTFTVSLIQ